MKNNFKNIWEFRFTFLKGFFGLLFSFLVFGFINTSFVNASYLDARFGASYGEPTTGTITAGLNQLLFCTYSSGGAVAPFYWGTQLMTDLGSYYVTHSNNIHGSVYLVNPNLGTHSISSANFGGAMSCGIFEGVNQAHPIISTSTLDFSHSDFTASQLGPDTQILVSSFSATPLASSSDWWVDSNKFDFWGDIIGNLSQTFTSSTRTVNFPFGGNGSFAELNKNPYSTGFNNLIPIPNQTTEYLTNNINFSGSVYGTKNGFEIWYGPPSASPATMLLGANITGVYNYNQDFSIPNGTWDVLYLFKDSENNVINSSTASILVQNPTQNSIDVYIASTTISSTTAIATLSNTTINCGSGAGAWIEDPNTFYNSILPSFLESGTSTTTPNSSIFAVSTAWLYAITRTPVDIMNRMSCYISLNTATEKGTAVGSLLQQLIATVNQINTLVNFPFTGLFLFWLIMIVLAFLRKLIPGFH